MFPIHVPSFEVSESGDAKWFQKYEQFVLPLVIRTYVAAVTQAQHKTHVTCQMSSPPVPPALPPTRLPHSFAPT
jgi:hypothetical protein